MSEIINLEEKKLSKLDNDELVVVAIEKASKQILEHSRLIKKLNSRVEELEERLQEKDEEISFIHRILDSD